MIEGIEKAFITKWEGWDGDQECIQFYNATLTSAVSEDLGIETAEVVELNLAGNTATFYDGWNPKAKWNTPNGNPVSGDYAIKRTFKLRLSLAEEIK